VATTSRRRPVRHSPFGFRARLVHDVRIFGRRWFSGMTSYTNRPNTQVARKCHFTRGTRVHRAIRQGADRLVRFCGPRWVYRMNLSTPHRDRRKSLAGSPSLSCQRAGRQHPIRNGPARSGTSGRSGFSLATGFQANARAAVCMSRTRYLPDTALHPSTFDLVPRCSPSSGHMCCKVERFSEGIR
jgi:hypothetical protein